LHYSATRQAIPLLFTKYIHIMHKTKLLLTIALNENEKVDMVHTIVSRVDQDEEQEEKEEE